jgi:hypothetical protein
VVNGDLNLGNTPITSLPKNLKVHGGLNLSGTQITSLPEGLTVNSYLDLGGTNVETLPESSDIGGFVWPGKVMIKQMRNLTCKIVDESNQKDYMCAYMERFQNFMDTKTQMKTLNQIKMLAIKGRNKTNTGTGSSWSTAS